MYLSNFAETGLLNTMRGISFPAPSQVFVGLFLSSPGEMGNTGTEISYSGYTRKPILFNSPAAEGMGIGIKNSEQITFAESPINAGTVRHIGIFDAAAGGNMYLYGELTEELNVLAGESPVLLISEVLFFSIGDLSKFYKTRLFNVIRGTTLSGFTPWCALFNGDPQNGGGELTGENYARSQLTFSAPAEEPSGINVIRNTVMSNFPRPTTTWGNWTHTAIFNAQKEGEPVWVQARSTPKVISKGIMPFVGVGDVTVGVN